MRSYTVHRRRRAIGDPEAEAATTVFVREGFAWAALPAPPLWFLYHRMWLALLAALAAIAAVNIVVSAMDLSAAIGAVVNGAVQLVLAAEANDLRRWTLGRRGYDMVAILVARNLGEAESRYFRRWRDDMIAHQKAHAPGSDARISFRRTSDQPVVGLFPEGGSA